MYMIFDQLYTNSSEQYYYKKYNTYLPIESGTVYKLSKEELEEYKNNGYKILKNHALDKGVLKKKC